MRSCLFHIFVVFLSLLRALELELESHGETAIESCCGKPAFQTVSGSLFRIV
jgi:hypothetical protein